MSRIGRRPVEILKGASVTVDGSQVVVKGPKGELSLSVVPEINVTVEDSSITVTRSSDVKRVKALHGLTRNLVSNMVTGVTEGYSKQLEIRGVGYRAEVAGRGLNLTLGFSHPVVFPIPEGIDIKVDNQTKVTVLGIDKQLVGETAAKIRAYRTPDAYKGKGVRYVDEVVRLKAGKAGGK